MSVIGSPFQCRLCQRTNTGYVNVFDASRADGIMVYEVIQELIQIEVKEDDGLPSTACRDCCTKLVEFSDFKKMCIRSARELKRKRKTEASHPVKGGLKVDRAKIDKDRLVPCTKLSAMGSAVVQEGGLTIGRGVIISKVPKEKSRTSGRITPEREEATLCPVTIKQEMDLDEEEVITDDFISVNRGAVLEEDATIRKPNRTKQSCGEAGAGVPRRLQTLPLQVFVSVGENCGLASKNDGSSIEKDPLCTSEEAIPSTLITMSEDRVFREERFSETSPAVGKPIIVRRLIKQEVDDDELETSSLSIADTSTHQGSTNVLAGEPSRAEGVAEVAVQEFRKGSPAVGSRDGFNATRGPRGSGNRDTDSLGHPFFFKCDECGKMCISRYLLKVHKRVHHSQDPLECQTCGRRFRTKGNLNIHIRTHTGEKPYACKTCDMRFAQKGTLERHFRTHTGERPYPCTICKKCFTTQDALTNHIRTHTGERPYPCEICGMRYKARNQLLAHMRIHSGDKPFCCVACGKRFGRKDSLNYHLQTHLDSVS